MADIPDGIIIQHSGGMVNIDTSVFCYANIRDKISEQIYKLEEMMKR